MEKKKTKRRAPKRARSISSDPGVNKQERAELLRRLQCGKTGVPVRDHVYRMRLYRNTFTGHDLKDWLEKNVENCQNPSRVNTYALDLLQRGAIYALAFQKRSTCQFDSDNTIYVWNTDYTTTTTNNETGTSRLLHTLDHSSSSRERKEGEGEGEGEGWGEGGGREEGDGWVDLGYGGGFGGEGGVDDDHEEIERAVSEYLVYRGFTQTCYSLYEEKRVDLSHEMQSERILSDFVGCIWSGSVERSVEFWDYLNTHFFSSTNDKPIQTLKSYLDNEWKKYFLTVAIRHHWMSVVSTFLDHHSYLSQEEEWVTWFTIPYISSPHNHPLLSQYLSTAWEQEFLSTLHNFLHTAITHGSLKPPPLLMSLNFERKKMASLQEELERTRKENHQLKEDKERAERACEKLKRVLGGEVKENEVAEKIGGEGEGGEELLKRKLQAPKFQRIHMNVSKPAMRKTLTRLSSLEDSPITQSTPSPSTTSPTPSTNPLSKSDQPDLSSSPSSPPSSPTSQRKRTATSISPSPDNTTQWAFPQLSGRGGSPPQMRQKGRAPSLSPPSSPPSPPLLPGQPEYVQSTSSLPPLSRPTTHTGGGGSSSEGNLPKGAAEHGAKRGGGQQGQGNKDQSSGGRVVGQQKKSQEHSFLGHLFGHTGAIRKCCFSSEGRFIASCARDQTVRVWSRKKKREAEVGREREGSQQYKACPYYKPSKVISCGVDVLTCTWEPRAERYLAYGTDKGTARLWRGEADRTVVELPRKGTTPNRFPLVVDVAFSPVDNTLFTVSQAKPPGKGGVVSLWDLKALTCVVEISSPTPIHCASFNHNGKILVTGTADGLICVYDLSQPKHSIMGWHAHDGAILQVKYDPTETGIVSVGADGKIISWSTLYDGVNKKPVMSFDWDPAPYHQTNSFRPALAFESQRENFFAIPSRKTTSIFRMDQQLPVLNVNHHSKLSSCVAWHPHYPLLLTGSVDHTLALSEIHL